MMLGKVEGRLPVFAALLAALLSGCLVGRPADGVDIGPSGGTVTLEDQGATAQLPTGALEQELEITLERADETAGLPTGAVPGTLVELGPAGLKFAKPVTLTIHYDRSKLPDLDTSWIRMVGLAGGKLAATLLVAHDTTTATITAKITTTGKYLLADLKLASAVSATQQQPLTGVDVLFVVDNSNSMEEEQKNLAQQFPKLISKLEQAKLDYRVGVVSSDLGAADFSFNTCEVPGGDGGKLQSGPGKLAPYGCATPPVPWIEKTSTGGNVPDPVASFACIATLGTGGCGFEHQLESARKALSPGVNPGFVRPNAGLAVVFITDEDDCSGQKGELFNPGQQGLSDPLGPLSSFRCFEFGVTCDVNGRTPGARTNCKPSTSGYLQDIVGYTSFFKGLKPAGQLMLAAIAGPAGPVEVGLDGVNPTLKPSCQSAMGQAAPGIRIKALMDSMGSAGHFNMGRTAGQEVAVNICSTDFSPALSYVGDLATTNLLTSWCLPYRPADTNPLTAELDADCRVSGAKAGPIPACQPGAATACFVVENSQACGTNTAVRIQNLDPQALGAQAEISCLVL